MTKEEIFVSLDFYVAVKSQFLQTEDPVLKFCDDRLDIHSRKEVSREKKSVSQSFLSFQINIKSLFHFLLFLKKKN